MSQALQILWEFRVVLLPLLKPSKEGGGETLKTTVIKSLVPGNNEHPTRAAAGLTGQSVREANLNSTTTTTRHSCLLLFILTPQSRGQACKYCPSHTRALRRARAIIGDEIPTPHGILPIEMSQWVLERFLWDNAALTELGAGLATGKINRWHQNELNLGNYKHLKVLICMIILTHSSIKKLHVFIER